MTRVSQVELATYLTEWLAAPSLPLEVRRAAYDDPAPRSWEVAAWETPTCTVPIAEFTEWAEAQRFADERARWALAQGAWPRRWNLSYRPDGSWGAFGYWEPQHATQPEHTNGSTT
ncbi:hypothetical protein [Microbacterium oleivorans]|uniref:Uncharacterized protein n=1 Tax=Microbacterium oleivorans TaxID=273677 RepID=A0A7D5F7H8_9MICO|nr:hypothetical protein [Microbacterium oleivorans]QLD10909.1 hypothetical protein HW566_03375 [Microbacterium oleivorans]